MHILFVDDESDTCELFSMLFTLEGHRTKIVHNGPDAVKAVQRAAFDAIVMDVEIPFMNGIEATRQIRQLPNGKRVPILVFTGYSGHDYERKALEAGADEVLYKPILPKELLKCLASLLKNRGR